ncbi:hypothetical protein [Saccharothrix xinjiangensis]|uniref:Uncharacterized protein n=1 Tax=Saccharothrix xinjiangensis TaxID=204798 RepID=A0ABV9XTC2_9PSEU
MSTLLGEIVLYTITGEDVRAIEELVPRINGAGRTNLNPPHVGDQYPALVVRDNGSSLNLKVQLDGGADAAYWATSRAEGDELGQWRRR